MGIALTEHANKEKTFKKIEAKRPSMPQATVAIDI